MLTVQAVTDPESLWRLCSEWEDLDAELSPRLPFTGPLWNMLWWRHMPSDNIYVRDSFYAHVVRDAASRLIAVAPMMLTRRPRSRLFPLRELGFFGADPNMTEIRGLACRPADQYRAMLALSAYFIERDKNWDWLKWGGIHKDAHLAGELDDSISLRAVKDVPDYYLRLPRSWDELKAGLSRNTKEALRKCYNSLKRDGHAFTFRVIDRPDESAAAISRFFLLHKARAARADMVRHRDVFAAEKSRRFLRDYAHAMAERDSLRVFEILVAGKVVASRIGFVFGKELYLYYSGFNPDWSKYSIMTTVVAEAIKWAVDQRFDIVNLSTGNDPSKLRWGPQETLYRQGVLVAPTLRGQLAFAAYSGGLALSQTNEYGGFLSGLRRSYA
ncbi:GNAT family N-acetyltransferase [Methylocapsa acidiphila]|uniref:GNAT family N-acetyltransferase n=1 Tax=Methylocapsa acidiphila TaxID=133552 RepID=UPI0004278AED|nr:GNAT family N-acetyltransferase [Methylocapsa acidiphila]